MKNRIPLGRLVAEFFVIVVGVLTAFSVDATWDGRQEANEVARDLAALEAELDNNLDRLTRAISAHDAIAQTGFGILRLTGPDASLEDQADALALIPAYSGTARAQLSSSALSVALEARVLRTVADPELRRILAELPSAYANLTLWEDRIARLMEERVFPQLWLHVPQMNMEIAAAYGGTGPLWEEFVESVPSQSRFNPDGAALLGDMVFENAVVERTTLLQGGRTLSEGVYQMIEAALERLADEQP